MKRITAIVLCFVLIATGGILLSSCSKNEPKEEETTVNEVTEIRREKEHKAADVAKRTDIEKLCIIPCYDILNDRKGLRCL